MAQFQHEKLGCEKRVPMKIYNSLIAKPSIEMFFYVSSRIADTDFEDRPIFLNNILMYGFPF